MDVINERKIPAALWRNQLLKLVSEAPRAQPVQIQIPEPHSQYFHIAEEPAEIISENTNSNFTISVNDDTQSQSSSNNSAVSHSSSQTSAHGLGLQVPPQVQLNQYPIPLIIESKITLTNGSKKLKSITPPPSKSPSKPNSVFSTPQALRKLIFPQKIKEKVSKKDKKNKNSEESHVFFNGESSFSGQFEKLSLRSSPSPVSSSGCSSGGLNNKGSSDLGLGYDLCDNNGGNSGFLVLQENSQRLKQKSPFGQVYHGFLNHLDVLKLLKCDGEYLVRKRNPILEDSEYEEEDYILSFRFNGHLKNFSLVWDPESELFYLDDKCKKKGYGNLEQLVQEGLITLYLELKAGSYIDLMVDLTRLHTNDKYGKNTNLYDKSQVSKNSKKNTTQSKSSIERQKGNHSSELLEHSFHLQTFDGLHTCQLCQNFLWGMSSQGLQCKDCTYSIHVNCVEKVVQECIPKLSEIKIIFGSDLTTIVKGCRGRPTFVLEKLVTEIEKKGLNTEGIYRVSGSREMTERLKNLLENDRENTELSSFLDIHSMCGLVKLYLRLLPIPLITNEVFSRFLDAKGTITLDILRRDVNKLPPAHYITLKYLLMHLNRVTEFSEKNKMSSFNLSSVFTPTIISASQMSLNALKVGTSVLEMMISHVYFLFPPPSTVIM